MGAALRDAPVLQYEYLVRAAHSGNALRNNDLCTGIGKLLKIFAQLLFGLQVDRRGGVVQDQDLRLLCQRAGQGDALLLAAGKPVPCSPMMVSKPSGSEQMKSAAARRAYRATSSSEMSSGALYADVAADGVGIELHALRRHADAPPQRLKVPQAHVHAVHQHRAAADVQHARDGVHQRGFAAACGAQYGQRLPLRYGKADVLQRGGAVVGVSDGNAAELHAAAAFALGAPVLGVLDPRAGKINFNDLCGGGEEPLKIVQVGAQRAHRLRQAPGHQRKGGEVAGRHFSLDDEQTGRRAQTKAP